VEECLDRITEGCNTPPGLFLDPGVEAIIPITYNCKNEELFPSSGECGDLMLSTEVGHVFVQAVYCEDFDAAQGQFCKEVHPSLVVSGEPWSQLPAVDITDCP